MQYMVIYYYRIYQPAWYIVTQNHNNNKNKKVNTGRMVNKGWNRLRVANTPKYQFYMHGIKMQ